MNLVAALVGASIAGVAAPSISQMAITPYVAQLQSVNFTEAEALAVTVAAQAEATSSLPNIPSGCSISPPVDSVYQVTCNAGDGRFGAVATRSFRILDEIDDGGTGGRVWAHSTPDKFSPHQCPTYDTWGVDGYNDQWAHQLGGACKPHAAWNRNAYLASDPDAWLYDINNINGWGHHEGY